MNTIAKTIFSMMINPSKLKNQEHNIVFAVVVSGIAFMLFFLQTALDLFKTGQKDMSYTYKLSGIGFAYGVILIPVLGVLVWLILKIVKSEQTLKQTVATICLSYSGAMIYGLMGIMFSLFFQWKTSIAFGITGVLWATGPIIVTLKGMTKGKTALSVILASIVSSLVLICWSLLTAI